MCWHKVCILHTVNFTVTSTIALNITPTFAITFTLARAHTLTISLSLTALSLFPLLLRYSKDIEWFQFAPRRHCPRTSNRTWGYVHARSVILVSMTILKLFSPTALFLTLILIIILTLIMTLTLILILTLTLISTLILPWHPLVPLQGAVIVLGPVSVTHLTVWTIRLEGKWLYNPCSHYWTYLHYGLQK